MPVKGGRGIVRILAVKGGNNREWLKGKRYLAVAVRSHRCVSDR
jgi:hypothetical protein